MKNEWFEMYLVKDSSTRITYCLTNKPTRKLSNPRSVLFVGGGRHHDS